MASLDRRLSAIEGRLHVGLPTIVTIEGGVPSPEGPTFATAGNHRWDRAPGETIEVFRTRVLAVAALNRLPFVIVGGIGPFERVDPSTYEPTPQEID